MAITSNGQTDKESHMVTKPFWTKKKLEERAMLQNNPDSLDMERLLKVSKYAPSMWKKDMPIHFTAFPMLPYESAGNANKSFNIEFKGNKIKTESILLGKDIHNEHRFKDENKLDEIVFTIIVLTDSVDQDQTSYVSSRNHPNYIAEGTIPTSRGPIDWISIQNADDTAYAVISMRLFNLNFGQVIIVNPKKDSTLRFLQVKRDFLSSQDLEGYLTELIKSEEVVDFLTRVDNQ